MIRFGPLADAEGMADQVSGAGPKAGKSQTLGAGDAVRPTQCPGDAPQPVVVCFSSRATMGGRLPAHTCL